jgi:hypothetical protein
VGSRPGLILNSGDDTPDSADIAAGGSLLRAMLTGFAAHSRDDGRIRYASLEVSPEFARAAAAARALRVTSLRDAERSDLLAFWINVYNALVLHAVVALRIRRTVREVRNFFGRVRYQVGLFVVSLDDIEHGILRGNRRRPFPPFRPFGRADARRELVLDEVDPRVHFALSCGARSCPPVAVYTAAAIDAQLGQAAANFVNQDVVVAPNGRVSCSRLFKWYAGDFGGASGVRAFLMRHLDAGPVRDAVAITPPPLFHRYRWELRYLAAD